jgi:DNA-binding LytR/AlgR family response regulator
LSKPVYLDKSIHGNPNPACMTKQPFFFRQDGLLKKIKLDEILFLEVDDNYVKFHAADYKLMVRATLDAVLKQIPQSLFVQVHRSFAVSVHHVVEIGRVFVELAGMEKAVPVSKLYFPEFIKQINIIGYGLDKKN